MFFHVTGIRVISVPMCSEPGSLPELKLMYTIYRFTA